MPAPRRRRPGRPGRSESRDVSRRGRPALTLPVVLVLAALLLASCVGDVRDDPDALSSPSLSPSPLSSPEPSGARGGRAAERRALRRYYTQRVAWERCRGDKQCATIEVPLDYRDPAGRAIEIALLKAPAGTRSQRVGSLVVNPGGPGGSGIEYAANAGSYFGPELRQAFDIVGFDPRGVGQSTPVDCLSDDELDAFVAADPDPDTPAEVRASDALVREFGEGCLRRSGDLVSHVSTPEAARDVDIIREVLGDRRLSWFGASYGTFLGATYAELFPERVGRMVLDGAIDPSLSHQRMTLVQARGFEVALRSYVAACVARGDCFLGDTVGEGTSRIRRFLDAVERDPLPAGDRDLQVGNAVLGVWAPLYNEAYWPTLDAALRSAFDGQGAALMLLANAYTSRGPDGYADNSLEALYAVNCLDHASAITSDDVAPLLPRFARASPTFGAIFAYGLSSCAQWPVASAEPLRGRALTAEGAAPILVIGTSRDPATPLAWAEALADQLESGVLVARDGDGHTGYNAGNACVDAVVEAYLVSGVVPQSDVSC